MSYQQVPLAGLDAINGGRLPGIAFYAWLGLPIYFSNSLDGVIAFLTASMMLTSSLVYFVSAKKYGGIVGITVFFLFSFNFIFISSAEKVLNPSFGLPFASLSLFLLIFGVQKRSFLYLFASVLAALICAQIHFSAMLLALSALIAVSTLRVPTVSDYAGVSKVEKRALILFIGLLF